MAEYQGTIHVGGRVAPYGDDETLETERSNDLIQVIVTVERWMEERVVSGGSRPPVTYYVDGELIPEDEMPDIDDMDDYAVLAIR